MSLLYDAYLSEHIGNVNKSLHWMMDNLPLSSIEKQALEDAMLTAHDESKYSKEEYEPYDNFFYGGNRSFKVCGDFDYAWLRHQHVNPHHWQYWALINDDPGAEHQIKALPIPLNHIFEMIADWWSFSWMHDNLFEIFKWYREHAPYQIMNQESRDIVEEILKKIWDVLIMQEMLANHDISEIEKEYAMFWTEQDEPEEAPLFVYPMDEWEGLTHSELSNEEIEKRKYGIPELRKFPMPDKKHVKSAIRFFNYVDPKYEKQLAEAILKRMEEYGVTLGKDITVGDDNRFKKYLPEEETK